MVRIKEFEPVPIQSRLLDFFLLLLPWIVLVVAIMPLLVEPELWSDEWQMMASTGMIAAAIAIFGFQVLMHRIRKTFQILWSRGIVRTRQETPTDTAQDENGASKDTAQAKEEYSGFVEATTKLSNHWGQHVLGVFIGLLAVGWTSIWHTLGTQRRIFDPILGYIVGLLAWRMIIVGVQVWQLGRKFDLTEQLVGHPDKCGGLEPIGSLCLWNAFIFSVAGVYLGAWVILMMSFPVQLQQLAEKWESDFKILLLVPVGIAVVSFFLPLWTIHRKMVEKKVQIQQEHLDKLGRSITSETQKLLNQADELEYSESERITKKLASMRKIYHDYKNIPVWPFNISILSKLSTLQIIPLLSLTGLGRPIVEAIGALFSLLTKTP